jgi:hypothetical protein
MILHIYVFSALVELRVLCKINRTYIVFIGKRRPVVMIYPGMRLFLSVT